MWDPRVWGTVGMEEPPAAQLRPPSTGMVPFLGQFQGFGLGTRTAVCPGAARNNAAVDLSYFPPRKTEPWGSF